MSKETSAASPAVSGSYTGFLSGPTGAPQRLDLRVDVDARIDQGSVLNRVSGDIFRVDKVNVPGQPPKQTEIYQESWILEQPVVKAETGAVSITGVIRFWNGVHPKTTVTIRIPLTPAGAAAEVTLLKQSAPAMMFLCPPAGIFFRSLRMEIDVCASVNKPPILPTYGTHSLKERPPGLADRVLTLERSYGEAGIQVVLAADKRSVIDDSAITAWTDAELHNALEQNFSQYKGFWPKWECWGVLASQYEDDGVGGIMFDYAGADSGPGKSPERQGFAVFRKHEWFNALVPNPKTQDQLEAARKFLWTFTHEAGHTFNLMHSWDKNRASSLSWMNYDWKYDALHGNGEFWKGFRFRFDDEELLHIRHGNRSSVIMGGDPWSSGGFAESPPGAEGQHMPPGAMVSVDGEVPLEILVRSQQYFEFLEPVSIEIRARNLSEMPVAVSSTMHPEFGNVTIYVRRPDGRIVEYLPVSCKVAKDVLYTLAPAGAQDGSDRRSRTVFVAYGRYGFYFDEPGQYVVRVVYHGPGNLLIPSNTHRLRIGHPKSESADRMAQDFFSYEAGAALYLGGSHSDFLDKGMDTLMSMIGEQRNSLAAAKTAARIARGVGRPFHDLIYEPQEAAAASASSDADLPAPHVTVHRKTSGDTAEAMRLTELALKIFRHLAPENKALNIPIARCVRTRAEMLIGMGDNNQAHDEMLAMATELKKLGVNADVIEDIQHDAGTIETKKAKAKRPRSRRR